MLFFYLVELTFSISKYKHKFLSMKSTQVNVKDNNCKNQRRKQFVFG